VRSRIFCTNGQSSECIPELLSGIPFRSTDKTAFFMFFQSIEYDHGEGSEMRPIFSRLLYDISDDNFLKRGQMGRAK